MKILITGSKGFIGKNLIAELKNRKYFEILEYDLDKNVALLEEYCEEAEFVFHLAGVNRPKTESDFMEGNFNFLSTLLENMKKYHNTCPIMMSSSIQAQQDNPYGRSKKEAEELLFEYGRETTAKVLIYRFPNVFGKWCKPNYNSVVSTFCHNIAMGLPITVNESGKVINLVYIDDVIEELIYALNCNENRKGDFCEVPVTYSITLGEIAGLIYSFRKSREEYSIPDMDNGFCRKLYSTYLSYLPKDQFSYKLKVNEDHRGSFTEFIKTQDRGQVSVNISKPGITKGNHWHHSKNEKFLVVCGEGVIRFRDIHSDEIIEYFVDGSKMEVVDVPTGYTHNIQNLGHTDLVTIMWANECHNPEKPDTYFLEV